MTATTSHPAALAGLIKRGRDHAHQVAKTAAQEEMLRLAERGGALAAAAERWIAERIPSLAGCQVGARCRVKEATHGTIDLLFEGLTLRYSPGMTWCTYDATVRVGARCWSCGRWVSWGSEPPRSVGENDMLAWIALTLDGAHPGCPCQDEAAARTADRAEVTARLEEMDSQVKDRLAAWAAVFVDRQFTDYARDEWESEAALAAAITELVYLFVDLGLWGLPSSQVIDTLDANGFDINNVGPVGS